MSKTEHEESGWKGKIGIYARLYIAVLLIVIIPELIDIHKIKRIQVRILSFYCCYGRTGCCLLSGTQGRRF